MVSPNPACKDSSAGGCAVGDSNHSFIMVVSQVPLPSFEIVVTWLQSPPWSQYTGWHKSHSQPQPLASIPGCGFPSCSCRLSLSSTTSLPGKPWQVMLSVEVCSPSRKKSAVLMSVVKYFKVC